MTLRLALLLAWVVVAISWGPKAILRVSCPAERHSWLMGDRKRHVGRVRGPFREVAGTTADGPAYGSGLVRLGS